MGKFLAILIVVCSVVAGGGLYYLQVYHFYEEVQPTGTDDVQLTVLDGGVTEPIVYEDFQAIDADSSPIRYRACFTTPLTLSLLSVTYALAEDAVPLEAPSWFDCFDADAVGAGLEDGSILAFMGTENIRYGIDRIVAISETGQGYVWQQINACGDVVFDGQPAPDGCPEPPQEN